MATTSSTSQSMVDPTVFQNLQAKIDEDSQIRQEIRDIVQTMERQDRHTMSILSRCHSVPEKDRWEILVPSSEAIATQRDTIKRLQTAVSGHPYYKYNGMWSRELQNICFSILLSYWLRKDTGHGKLRTIEEVGNILEIPVNLKTEDSFHLTIEEYLHALISLIEELARLAVNAVTLGDYEQPLQISKFVKDLHAGFQILNLKNDSLRRRSDGIKYQVKKIEDVVYDLSLRGLVPREGGPK